MNLTRKSVISSLKLAPFYRTLGKLSQEIEGQNPKGLFSGIEAQLFSTAVSAEKKEGEKTVRPRRPPAPPGYRFVYPEFLPDPNLDFRNPIREKLERFDMLNRRKHIDIPEFYVGSILAVTTSDPHAEGKTNRFVGICIERSNCGLRAQFTLRNVINNQGIEVRYLMYDPTLQKVEVLRLEKRPDETLFYLRDALPEYSTFDVNMEPELLPEGTEVPVNPLKVVLKPRPWLERWERQNLQGVANILEHCKEKHLRQAKLHVRPWVKFDLMKEYRASVPEEEQRRIFSEVYSEMHQLELSRKKQKRKRTFVKPQKLA